MKVAKSQVDRISQMHKLIIDVGDLGIQEMLAIKNVFQEWNDEDFKAYIACQEQIAEGLKQAKEGVMALEHFLEGQMEKDGVINDSEGEDNAGTTIN